MPGKQLNKEQLNQQSDFTHDENNVKKLKKRKAFAQDCEKLSLSLLHLLTSKPLLLSQHSPNLK